MKTLLWRNATRTHDWMDLEIPLHILETWLSLGLVKHADWMEGKGGKPRRASIAPSDLSKHLPKHPVGKDNRIVFRIGGDSPRQWSLTAFIFPSTEGMSLFNLSLGLDSQEAISAPLMQGFTDLYNPEMVDSAIIHADPQWTLLASGPYKPPLVTTPTFAGVFWANFLGPGHLAEFCVPKLHAIQAYRVKWHGERGLSVISTSTFDEALTPDGEKELLRLTAEFRAAKKLA
jgi:hypothetical protein